MSPRTRRTIPPAGSVARPWLWQVWAAVGALFMAIFAVHFLFPPPLVLSAPVVSYLGDTCTVTFGATNNAGRPTTGSVAVNVGIGTPASSKNPPKYIEAARRLVAVSLAPRESRKFSCEFPITGYPRPNTAHVEIEATHPPIR